MNNKTLRIEGTGTAQPRSTLTSLECDVRMGQPAGWTESNFAIRERRVAQKDETSSALGAIAAHQALETAQWSPNEVDVVIGACGVMEQPIPGTATLVHRRLGLGGTGIPAFDVNATCLSFLIALDLVQMAFASGRWRRALVISSDIASAALDFRTPEASVIFGDGAAAVAVEACEGSSAILAFRQETYSDGADLCQLQAGGTRLRPHEDLAEFIEGARFKMDGPGVFRAVARRFPRFMSALLKSADLQAEDIDLIVPHQASAAAIEHLRRSMPGPSNRVVNIFADHGNQIAASLPNALHAAVSSGRLRRGDTALLVGTAAGVSLGGALLRF